MPSWEKQFCRLVGSVSWKKLLDTKSSMYLYSKVVEWNDSAVEEAFNNAKERFWAEINGRKCDIPLPDPNTYIDEIDWNHEVDPELLLDLEQEFVSPNLKENVLIFGESFLSSQNFLVTDGWGDDFREDCGKANGWGADFEVDCGKGNGWGDDFETDCWKGNGWGDDFVADCWKGNNQCANLRYQNPEYNTPRQWNSVHPCRPVRHRYDSSTGGNCLSWKKPVY